MIDVVTEDEDRIPSSKEGLRDWVTLNTPLPTRDADGLYVGQVCVRVQGFVQYAVLHPHGTWSGYVSTRSPCTPQPDA